MWMTISWVQAVCTTRPMTVAFRHMTIWSTSHRRRLCSTYTTNCQKLTYRSHLVLRNCWKSPRKVSRKSSQLLKVTYILLTFLVLRKHLLTLHFIKLATGHGFARKYILFLYSWWPCLKSLGISGLPASGTEESGMWWFH